MKMLGSIFSLLFMHCIDDDIDLQQRSLSKSALPHRFSGPVLCPQDKLESMGLSRFTLTVACFRSVSVYIQPVVVGTPMVQQRCVRVKAHQQRPLRLILQE